MPGPDERRIFDYPHKVQLQTYDSCNYRCGSCPYPTLAPTRPRTRAPLELLTRIIEQTRQERRTIRLCLMLQNEPLLDARFEEFLAQAHDADDVITTISTVTNGSTLSPRILDHLLEYERLSLTVSVNANTRARYQEIHGVDRWDKVRAVLETWQGRRDRVRLSFVVHRDNIDEGREFWERWRRLGYRARLVPLMSRAGFIQIGGNKQMVSDDFGHCHYPVDTLNVFADGTVGLCCNDWVKDETFGNLHQRTVAEIWNGERFSEIRAAALAGNIQAISPTCRGCDYPLRSSIRMLLEGLATGHATPGKEGELSAHVSQFRTSANEAIPLVVYDVDPEQRVIWGACAAGTGAEAVEGSFCIRIAHGERFSFGSLAPVWCEGLMQTVGPTTGKGGEPLQVVRIDLRPDPDADALLRWYEADWRIPAPPPEPQP